MREHRTLTLCECELVDGSVGILIPAKFLGQLVSYDIGYLFDRLVAPYRKLLIRYSFASMPALCLVFIDIDPHPRLGSLFNANTI